MAYKLIYSDKAELDIERIFDFLFESYLIFGETAAVAFEKTTERITSIRNDARRLEKAPFRGTICNDIGEGVRHVTLGRAVFWFDILEEPKEVVILAVFFGGEDHRGQMTLRSLQ